MLVDEYLGRLGVGSARWLDASARVFPTEEALLEAVTEGKSQRLLVLLDSCGKTMSSEQFADWIGTRRYSGAQEMWLAIGPADGWSPTAADGAELVLSLGAMTLAHELARVVVAEQLYRAWAILERHPYHKGH
jgi:23S rRNA (pseudouridine1915-N3)-methyltransferase